MLVPQDGRGFDPGAYGTNSGCHLGYAGLFNRVSGSTGAQPCDIWGPEDSSEAADSALPPDTSEAWISGAASLGHEAVFFKV